LIHFFASGLIFFDLRKTQGKQLRSKAHVAYRYASRTLERKSGFIREKAWSFFPKEGNLRSSLAISASLFIKDAPPVGRRVWAF
jgi:hypothetical protein